MQICISQICSNQLIYVIRKSYINLADSFVRQCYNQCINKIYEKKWVREGYLTQHPRQQLVHTKFILQTYTASLCFNINCGQPTKSKFHSGTRLAQFLTLFFFKNSPKIVQRRQKMQIIEIQFKKLSIFNIFHILCCIQLRSFFQNKYFIIPTSMKHPMDSYSIKQQCLQMYKLQKQKHTSTNKQLYGFQIIDIVLQMNLK
eukprot:TRINITY_DN1860_c3_g1_i3.p1 TRINITY_DN1860_c3_g1~~TRINITY_DN1860_c3_g1_i3.p1  ORF type:complete len:201 (-),score=-21.22 TRINITY_DN1860_c3_g1_i3:209-811(-)